MARLIDENGDEIDLEAMDPTEAEAETNDEVENEGQEGPETEANEADEDSEQGNDEEGQIVLEIDGKAVDEGDDDDPDLAETEDDTPVIRKMRQRLREAKRRERELTRQMEQAAQAETPPPDVGERPTLDQFDYDEDAHAEAVMEWLGRKMQADQKAAEERERAERLNKAFEAKKAAYEVNKARLNAPDFDSAEAAIKSTFTPTAQGVMLAAAKEPERVVYALGKSVALREALAKVQDDPIAMAAEIGRMESRIQLKPRKPATQPERRVQGSASTGKSAVSRDFERALETNNGDMTDALKIYRQKARAG